MEEAASRREPQYTAVVHAADGVRFVASADSRGELASRIVDYIRERCDYTLWPAVAAAVRALIEDKKPLAAIAKYFENVGERWDAERLELSVPLDVGVTGPHRAQLTA